MRRVGTNQIGRYSIHFHHAFGPKATPANGYQFTLIGNAVDDASKWGITVHNSHYGLVRDNVVYNSRGAAIVAEDGTESFNVFEHNFALRSEGSGEFAPRSGYGGATNDPGGEGAGFWLRGPNNILRNNVAANVDVFGYGIAAGSLGVVSIPKFKGADTTKAGEFVEIDTTDAPVLEFTGNEAYGAIQTGRRDRLERHADRLADVAYLAARGDGVPDRPAGRGRLRRRVATRPSSAARSRTRRASGSATTRPRRSPSRTRTCRGCASASPARSSPRPTPSPGAATAWPRSRTATSATTWASRWPRRTRRRPRRRPIKKAVVRNSRFDPLGGVPAAQYPAAAISMNYGMSAGRCRSPRPGRRVRLQRQAGRHLPCVLFARGAGERRPGVQHRARRHRRFRLRRR